MEPGILNAMTRRILGSAIEVHRVLGPGLLESTYRKCLVAQLRLDGIEAAAEVEIPITYKGVPIPGAYRGDIAIGSSVLLELKAVERLEPIHTAQILTYLRHSSFQIGLLINFNEPTLMKGVRRYIRFTPRLDESSAPPSAAAPETALHEHP